MKENSMLDKMNDIDDAFVEEADKPYLSRRRRVPRMYYVGMAAGFAIMILSGGLILFGGADGAGAGTDDTTGWVATAISRNSSIPIIFLGVGVTIIALFAFLVVRARKNIMRDPKVSTKVSTTRR